MTHGTIDPTPKPVLTAPRTAARWLGWLAVGWRLAFGALFLWTSVPKILDPLGFLASVQQYQLLPPAAAQVLAVVLPWTEFVLGVCLLSGRAPCGAWLSCAGLFGVFGFAHASVLARGMSIDCGCGIGLDSEHISIWTLLRSVVLLALSLAGWGLGRKTAQLRREGGSEGPATAIEPSGGVSRA